MQLTQLHTQPIHPRPAPGRHRSRRATVAIVVLLAIAFLGACVGTDQANALKLVRSDRSAHGVRTISTDAAAQRSAQSHAAGMASSGRLYHSKLRLSSSQCAMGENVGVAGSISQAESLFMGSSSHRANILNSRYDHIGIGVVRSGGRTWVVQLFIDKC